MPIGCYAKLKTAPVQQRGALPVAAEGGGRQFSLFVSENIVCVVELLTRQVQRAR